MPCDSAVISDKGNIVAHIQYSHVHKTWKRVFLKGTESQNHSGGKRPQEVSCPRQSETQIHIRLLGLYLVGS